MSGEILVLSAEEINSKPSEIGEAIAQLALAIQDSKTNLEEIQNRNFWKKLINNNTRDLAQAMLKQNDTISAFLTIIQGVILLSMNNLVVLGGIMDSLNKQETTNEFRDNKYIGMAKSYLSEAIKAAQKASMNENEIKTIRSEIVEISQIQTDQSTRMDNLTIELNKLKSQIVIGRFVVFGSALISVISLVLYFVK